MPFGKHCVIQTYRGSGPAFRTAKGDPATFKEEHSAPKKTLIGVG